MKALVQRVGSATVSVGGIPAGSIGRGLLVLAGFGRDDTEADLDWMASRLVNLRIFPDASGDMNLSLLDSGGDILAVSQFTLHADCSKGRRPSFMNARDPLEASALFDLFTQKLRAFGPSVPTGVFGAMMEVALVNDGPVTIMLDSPSERRRS